MGFGNEDLDKIEEFAGKLLTVEEIAVILEVNVECFSSKIIDGESAEAKAYMKGLLLAKAKLHSGIIKLANAGSAPAQAIMMKMVQRMEMEKMLREL